MFALIIHEKKFKYEDLLKEYEQFKVRKAKLEDLFAARYNKRVEIKRVEYVYKNEFMEFLK